MGFYLPGPGSLAFCRQWGGTFITISATGIVTVAAANTQRQKIMFHNPGTNDVFIALAYVQNTGSNVALSPV